MKGVLILLVAATVQLICPMALPEQPQGDPHLRLKLREMLDSAKAVEALSKSLMNIMVHKNYESESKCEHQFFCEVEHILKHHAQHHAQFNETRTLLDTLAIYNRSHQNCRDVTLKGDKINLPYILKPLIECIRSNLNQRK